MEEFDVDDLSFYGGNGNLDDDFYDSTLSFVDLLSLQNSIFDLPPPPLPSKSPSPSSSSTEASESATDLLARSSTPDTGEEVEGKEPNATKNEGRDEGKRRGKRKGQKRQRQPRFAFMTKSEVDHLEDGYRWRKYGQKAVKNSPFPRSYYRCTSASCGVKKRVERSCNDPSVVVTTYEGQHTHSSPVGIRGAPPGATFHHNTTFPFFHNQQQLILLQQHQQHFPAFHQQQQQQQQQHQLQFPNNPLPPPSMPNLGSTCYDTRRHVPSSSDTMDDTVRDCGLLQDMVPSDMIHRIE